MKLPITLIKSIIGSGLKPLPLSGILKEFKELKQSKFAKDKVIETVMYIIGGSIVWAVIFGKIDMETAKSLLELIGF